MTVTALQLDTPRFGTVTATEEALLEFPAGLIGLPDCRRFARVPFHDAAMPFEWLQCIDDVAIAFLITDPQAFFPEYGVTVPPEDLTDIELTEDAEGQVRCIVTVPERVGDMTANLLAPVVVNTRQRLAKQVVLADPRYLTKHRLFPEAAPDAGSQPTP